MFSPECDSGGNPSRNPYVIEGWVGDGARRPKRVGP